MKKFVLVCLASVIASPAFASKARVNALQGVIGLYDTQTIFTQPAYIHKVDKFATFEMGSTSVSGTPRAEGGFMTESDGTRWGAYLGHQSDVQNVFRGTTFQKQDNPVDFLYGSGNMGLGLSLSNSEDTTTETKQTTIVARAGWLLDGEQEVAVSVDALATAEKKTGANTDKLKTKLPTIQASYLKRMGANNYMASVAYGNSETEIATATTDVKLTSVNLGMNHWLVANNLYAGVSLSYASLDVGGKKLDTVRLPLVLGFEKEAASWLVLRGSVQQGFLLGNVKDDSLATSGKEKKNLNDTTVAAGLGVKHNGFALDALFSASNSGKLNGNDFLSQAALTYWF